MNCSVQSKLQKMEQTFSRQNLLLFLILFAVLVFRTPGDLFIPYLFAEDGSALIQGSIYNGVKGVFMAGNGAYWVIQKALGLLCYWLVRPTGSIAALPYIMQILFKMLGTLAVMYFMSDRFSWLVEKKTYRFGICVGIVLLMPQQSWETLACDTSLPFELLFAAFLIGLDLLCNGKCDTLNWGQTVFLTLLAMSSASALCIAAVAGAVFAQWLFSQIRARTLEKKALAVEIIKLALICGATLVQIQIVVSSGRVNEGLELAYRLIANAQSFVFFPYWNELHSWPAFFAGLIIWGAICFLTKLPWKTVLYCGGFSYLYMLYCSMSMPAESFYQGSMMGRFVFTSFEISALMIGVAVVRLLIGGSNIQKNVGYAVVTVTAIVSLQTYNVPIVGSEFAEIYTIYCDLYLENGQDQMRIPIGPWRPITFTIPTNISAEEMIPDIEFGMESLDGVWVYDENFGHLHNTWSMVWDTAYGEHELTGWVRTGTENQTLKRLFMKNGSSYTAAYAITEREFLHEEAWMHNGFNFNVPWSYFSEGTTRLEIVGEAENGTWHYGTIDIFTTLEWVS